MGNYAFIAIYLCVYVLIISVNFSHELSCKDERNKDVDWYVNYKIPKIGNEDPKSYLAQGTAYAYITAPKPGRWKLSSENVLSSSSMLSNTLENFYSNKKNATYLFYNDDPPAGFSGSAVGHLKGVLVFNDHSGYWLIHSIPKFASDNGYEYPDNALVNGQSVLCVTFRAAELNEICHQLLYSHPNIYSKSLTDKVADKLDDSAKSLFSDKPDFIRKGKLSRATDLKSLGNKNFRSFAKDNQLEEDLFSGIIAPDLETSLIAETWRRGSGTFLPPFCKSEFSVLDVIAINMTIYNRGKAKSIYFQSTEDHSKWAVALDYNSNWVCIADMNRMESQERRGGGAMCFKSKPVWNGYYDIISEYDTCKDGTREISGK